MNRREFVRWVGVGAIASSLPVAIAACGGGESASTSNSASPAPTTGGGTTVGDATVGGATVSELDQAGFINLTVDGQAATIVRNPEKADEILAVNTKCTHKGCTVAWKADQKSFVCPCHGAKYNAMGEVTNPPATAPLTPYKVNVNGDQITVTA